MIKTFDSNMELEGKKQIQADFSCEITSDKLDKTQIYETFEISASDAIFDIQEDKILLNPVLTDEIINNGTITNYSDPDNKGQLVIW